MLVKGALDILRDAAENGKGCAAASVDAMAVPALLALVKNTTGDDAYQSVRAETLQTAAAFVAHGIAEELEAALLAALEQALEVRFVIACCLYGQYANAPTVCRCLFRTLDVSACPGA